MAKKNRSRRTAKAKPSKPSKDAGGSPASPEKKDEAETQSMASMLQEYRNACNAWHQAEYEIYDAMSRLNYYWRTIAEFEDLKRLQYFVLDEVFTKLPPATYGSKEVQRINKTMGALWKKCEKGTPTRGELSKAYPGIWRFQPRPPVTVEMPSGDRIIKEEQAGRTMANILLRIVREKPDKNGRAILHPEFAGLWTDNPGFAKRWAEVHPDNRAGRPVNKAIAGIARNSFSLATEHSWFLLNGMEEIEGEEIEGIAIRFLRWPPDETKPFVMKVVTPDELARCRRLVRFITKYVATPCEAPDIPMLSGKFWKAQIDHFDEFWQIVLEPTAKAEWKAAQRHLNKGNGEFSDAVMQRFGYEWAKYCCGRTVRSRRKWSNKIKDTMKRFIREYLLSSSF